MIKKVALTGVWVSDQDVSRSFYVDKLGFEIKKDTVMENGSRWLEVMPSGGETSLTLAKPYLNERYASVGVFTNIVFARDDIDSTFENLKSNGVKFIEEPSLQEWGMKQALFEDPDGNVFVLVENAE